MRRLGRRTSLALLYASMLAATWLARVTPVGFSYRLARLGGLGAYLAWPGGRRRCVRNMLHVSNGDHALARRYARRSFAYYGTYLIDFLRFGGLDSQHIRERVDFDDWDSIERERGRGVLFVTLHFGNWDLAAAAIVDRGLPMTAIADSFAHSGINRLVMGARRRLGIRVVPAERLGVEVVRALQRDDVVAMLADVPWRGGVEVEFFGSTVSVPDGPARIALRLGAPILVGGLWRQGPTAQRYTGGIERVVDIVPSGDRERDVRVLTQEMMRALERLVERAPEQWYIFRSLWLEDQARGTASSLESSVA